MNLITPNNINEYIKDLPTYFYNMCPAHQADIVRVYVIYEYGYIWLDSDTLVLDKLDSLFYYIEKNNGFFIKQNNQILWNGIFGSKNNTPLMIKWKNDIIKILDEKNQKIEWDEIGNILIQNIYNNYIILNGLDNLYPINWDNCVNEFIKNLIIIIKIL